MALDTALPNDGFSLPAKMRGIIFAEKGKAVFQEEPTPGCDSGKILCESIFTGLTNGTERNVLMGGNYGGAWPSRCGYQNVGRVLAVDMGVKGFQPGDIVFSGDFCQHTQYFTAPAQGETLLVKLPGEVDPKHAALFGIASVAMHDVRRAASSPEWTAGNNSDVSTPMMEITTSSSTSVKPRRRPAGDKPGTMAS